MARLAALEKVVEEDVEEVTAPVEVDIANDPVGGRVLTINLPDYVEITDEERAEIEAVKGPALARCDATGKLIHNEKNINEIHNDKREEFAGLVLSTAVLRPLIEALNRSKNK